MTVPDRGFSEEEFSTRTALRIADATSLVRGLRMVKSKAEIEKIAHICAISSRTFARVPDFAHEGQAPDDTFRAFLREGLAQGADDVPYLVGSADTGGYITTSSLRLPAVRWHMAIFRGSTSAPTGTGISVISIGTLLSSPRMTPRAAPALPII